MTNQKKKIRLLIVSGGASFENTIFRIIDVIEEVELTHIDSDKEAFTDDLREKYDVVIMYNLNQNPDEEVKKNLKKFVEASKGVIVLHHAIATYNSWQWWYKEVVGGRYLMQPEGNLPSSNYMSHQEIIGIPVGKHPITSSLEGLPLHIYDETYKNMWLSPKIEVILQSNLFSSDKPLIWISPYDKSRVVVIIPGHGWGAHYNLGFRYLLKAAIFWVSYKT
ncbi:MAG: ThuA domain-containing protein [Candidatus Lokiarchaeota archaeon]|nr:ThuA domain-containing protein [Candidatus Lokiarchaeota archaeon]